MGVFLIDNNLPPSLSPWLALHQIEAVHVKELDLASEMDTTIWKFAQDHDFAILTKDRDFDRFAVQNRLKCRPVFRLQIGNATKANLFSWLEVRLDILHAFQQGHDFPNETNWPPVVVIE